MDEEGNWHRIYENAIEHKIDFKDKWIRKDIPVEKIIIQSVQNGLRKMKKQKLDEEQNAL